MRCLVCLLTVILLPVMALAEGPIQNYSIDWEKDGNQYHVRTRMWNTTTLRYTFWQGTNAWAATGYTFKWHGAKSDSASSTIQVSGSINTNFSASNVVDFTFTSNQLSRTAEDWFSEVVVTAGSAVYSRPRGQLDIERSPGVNSASALALTAAIAGPSYGPFTGSFTGWPFATSTEFSSSVTSVTDTASITNSQVGQILSVYFKTPWGDVRYARSNVVAGLSTSVGNISNDLDGAETSLGNISNTVDGLLPRDGSLPPTADMPWGGYALTNASDVYITGDYYTNGVALDLGGGSGFPMTADGDAARYAITNFGYISFATSSVPAFVSGQSARWTDATGSYSRSPDGSVTNITEW